MDRKTQDITVRHNTAEHRFEAEVEGQFSVAEYSQREGEITFTHTYTPAPLRGRGIAEKLVRTALDYAREQRLRVVPACSYVATYVQRHPEYQSLVK